MMEMVKKALISRKRISSAALLLTLGLALSAIAGTTLAVIVTRTPTLQNLFISGLDPVGDLAIHKIVEHPFGDSYVVPDNDNTCFHFRVDLGKENANKSFGSDTADENGIVTVDVKAGDTVSVVDIPYGTEVTVTEQSGGAGFSAQNGESKKKVNIRRAMVNSVSFTNIYTPAPAPADMTVTGTKTLEGREWQEGDSFTFRLERYTDGAWVGVGDKTITCHYIDQEDPDNPGQSIYAPDPDSLVFDFSDLIGSVSFDMAAAYSFRVTEVEGNIGGIAYDKAESCFDVLVGDADMDGALEIQSISSTSENTSIEGNAVTVNFRNSYAPAGSAEAVIKIQKTLDDTSGQNRAPAGFTFGLYDENGEPVTVSEATSASGETELRLVYTPSDAGRTFAYTLREINGGETIDGIQYDDQETEIYVSVVDNLDGTVSAFVYDDRDMVSAFGELALAASHEEDESAGSEEAGYEEESEEAPQAGEKESGLSEKFDLEGMMGQGALEESRKTEEPAGTEETGTSEEDTSDEESEALEEDITDEESETSEEEIPDEEFEISEEDVTEEGSETSEEDVTDEESEASEEDVTDEESETSGEDISDEEPEISEEDISEEEVLSEFLSASAGDVETPGIPSDVTSVYTASFTNIYDPENTEVSFEGSKELTGREMKEGEFRFALYETEADFEVSSDAQPLETVSNSADGSFAFGALEFAKIGTYYYAAVEDASDPLGGVDYDNTKYMITVRVSDEGGRLSAVSGITDESGRDSEIVFCNSYQAAGTAVTLSGSKKLTGRELEEGEFTFDLYRTDEEFSLTGKAVQSVKNHADGGFAFDELTFTDEGEWYYLIKENGTAGASGIVYDETEYRVTVAVTDDGAGELVPAVTMTRQDGQGQTAADHIQFANRYSPKYAALSLGGRKVLRGAALKEGMFAFRLYEADEAFAAKGEEVRRAVNNADGSFCFDALTYEEAGTYRYIMTEDDSDALDRISYDDTVYGVTVTVTDDGNGRLSAESSVEEIGGGPAEQAVFENTYTPAESDVSVDIAVKKTVKNTGTDTIGPEGFDFVLENTDTDEKAMVQSDEDGHAVFRLIFTGDDEGHTYHYRLYEEAGHRKGVVYSDTVYKLEITVAKDSDGALTAKVSCDGEPVGTFTAEFVNTYEGAGGEEPGDGDGETGGSDVIHTDQHMVEEPRTGDESNLLLWIVLIVVSAAVLLGFWYTAKKKKKDDGNRD